MDENQSLAIPNSAPAHRMCPHFSVCNGCPTMDQGYADQCEIKLARVQKVLQPRFSDVRLAPSKEMEFYRNRADFWYDMQSQLGFRSRETTEKAFAAPECQLVSRHAQHTYQAIAEQLKKMNLPPYEVTQHKGFLRYIVLRESKTDNKRVMGIITFTREHETEIEQLVQTLMEKKHIAGAVWMHNPEWGDTSNGEIIREWGETTLTEKMNGIHFTYSFPCFFQTNPKTAELAQRYIVNQVLPHENVLDLYCGAGLFSIPLAMKGNNVKGIELAKESIVWARKNAHAAGLDDDIISFAIGDVPKALQECEKNGEKYGVIILDPPRSGLSKKIWRRVLRLNPKQLLYVSCSLQSLQRDLEWLSEYAEFTVHAAQAFDFFPHTEHVETVVDIRITKIKEFPKGG